MGIRFSLKWLLAGMVYIALAAAALTQSGWAWADVLWFVSFLAVCYAALLAIIATEARRVRALGFLLGSLALLIAIQFAPDGVPIGRIVEAISPPPTLQIPISYPQAQATAVYQFPAQPLQATGTLAVTGQPRFSINPTMPPPLSVLSSPGGVIRLRAANAIAAMIAGIAGSLLGALAYRHHPGESPRSNAR